ncbi:MAG: ABC transporter substrate-binding protein [Hyphomicrobiales bacterium]|nr:ABC transporter substrate-binding protein [Hyphomicrobiales bacterium]MDE2018223.1 ABC transporter substrate-binding protein [Hyphomicrobiales bacterium]
MKRATLIGAALGALLAGVAGASAKTLVYCSEGSPESFSPALGTAGTTFDATQPVYDQLVEFKRGTTETGPGLAESWDVSADGKTIVFHLRKGVKFHAAGGFTPTRDFNADDVIFSFDRQMNPKNPYHSVSNGKFSYFNDMDMPKLIASVAKVDDYTVKFTLNEPNAPIIANLAMPFASIYSAEYADWLAKKGQQAQIDQTPVGTGPFYFVNYQKDAVIRYKKNELRNFGEKAMVDDLVFAITPDAAARFSKMKAGECQVNGYPLPADLPAIKADPKFKVVSASGLNIAYWSFNVTKPPMDNLKVREALSMAIDRDAIIKEVYGGNAIPAPTLIPPTMWSYDASIKPVAYDPAKAKALLAESGVKTPLAIELWYMPVTRPYNPNGKRIGEMMQADLAKVGVTATLKTFEWGEYLKRAKAGEDQSSQLGWTGDNGDPDNFFFLLGCPGGKPADNNISKWCDPTFNSLLEKARTLPDQAARAKLYQQMQVIEAAQQPSFLIAHSVVSEVTAANVTGYKMIPFGEHQFAGVDLK